MSSLRSELIRLAHAKPELRAHLLPLLKTAGEESISGLGVSSLAAIERARKYNPEKMSWTFGPEEGEVSELGPGIFYFQAPAAIEGLLSIDQEEGERAYEEWIAAEMGVSVDELMGRGYRTEDSSDASPALPRPEYAVLQNLANSGWRGRWVFRVR